MISKLMIKEGKEMKKIMYALARASAFSLAFFVATSFAGGGAMHQSEYRAYEVSKLVGADLKNPQGQDLGKITDLVVDSHDRVTFGILSVEGGKAVAVPFSAFRYDTKQNHLVLDVGKEKLASAPAFKREEIADRKAAEEVYRFYGLQPYWTTGNQKARNRASYPKGLNIRNVSVKPTDTGRGFQVR